MLETFREYGREQLIATGEEDATSRAHAAYMLVFAEEEHPGMAPAERETWLRGCDVEHDNFRAASHWLIAAADAEWALRLGSALSTSRRAPGSPRSTVSVIAAFSTAEPPWSFAVDARARPSAAASTARFSIPSGVTS